VLADQLVDQMAENDALRELARTPETVVLSPWEKLSEHHKDQLGIYSFSWCEHDSNVVDIMCAHNDLRAWMDGEKISRIVENPSPSIQTMTTMDLVVSTVTATPALNAFLSVKAKNAFRDRLWKPLMSVDCVPVNVAKQFVPTSILHMDVLPELDNYVREVADNSCFRLTHAITNSWREWRRTPARPVVDGVPVDARGRTQTHLDICRKGLVSYKLTISPIIRDRPAEDVRGPSASKFPLTHGPSWANLRLEKVSTGDFILGPSPIVTIMNDVQVDLRTVLDNLRPYRGTEKVSIAATIDSIAQSRGQNTPIDAQSSAYYGGIVALAMARHQLCRVPLLDKALNEPRATKARS
jgi:hypothetical protein